MRRPVLFKIIIGMLTLVLHQPLWAGEAYHTGIFGNTAAGGYDVVSYFDEQKAKKGTKEYRLKHDGVYWQFSSKSNLEKFQTNPQKFIPQYGGFCAWAVSAKNSRAPGDPKYWSIIDDKLYLNYNKKVQTDWLKDPQGFIKQGAENWPKLLND